MRTLILLTTLLASCITDNNGESETDGGQSAEGGGGAGGIWDGPNSGPVFTKGVVAGACPARGGRLDLQVLLLDGRRNIGPDAVLAREVRPVSELLDADSFVFSRLDTTPPDLPGSAFVETEEAMPRGLDLAPQAVEHRTLARRERLIVFALDHSGSLVGRDRRTSDVDRARATDLRDQRISFFRQLLSSLPESDYVSLVSFNERLPRITAEHSTPTRNRDIIEDGLRQITRDETGTTPLADAILQSYQRIIAAQNNADLDPIIVLFTDGVEEGDVSANTLAEAQAALVAHERPVPVIVLHLGAGQPRDKGLLDLACATGGTYIFLEHADEFTDSTANLYNTVVNLLDGAWHLTADAGLDDLPRGNYLISTELGISLGTNTRAVRLGEARNGQDINDTRLWIPRR